MSHLVRTSPNGEDNAAPKAKAAWDRLRKRMRTARQAYRQIFGIPDYERYLAHRSSHHPDEPPLAEREFYRQAIAGKYGRGGQRCC